MNIDNTYCKEFFDVWYDGLLDIKELSEKNIVANNGFALVSEANLVQKKVELIKKCSER